MAASTLTRPETTGHTHTGIFGRLARVATTRPRRVLAVWVLIALAAAPLAVTVSSALSGAWDAQGSTAQTVRRELRRNFPAHGAEAAVVVYTQASPIATDSNGLAGLVQRLATSPGTASVVDPMSLPPEAGLAARDGRTASGSPTDLEHPHPY